MYCWLTCVLGAFPGAATPQVQKERTTQSHLEGDLPAGLAMLPLRGCLHARCSKLPLDPYILCSSLSWPVELAASLSIPRKHSWPALLASCLLSPSHSKQRQRTIPSAAAWHTWPLVQTIFCVTKPLGCCIAA